MATSTAHEAPLQLDEAARQRLLAHLEAAVARARRRGAGVLASVTEPVHAGADPSAIACASRRPAEDWFALEHPDDGGAALAGLGTAVRIEAAGPGASSTSPIGGARSPATR